jgi:hypothetical protein
VKARPDYGPLFSILDGMRQDADRQFWIERLEAQEDNCDIEVDTSQMITTVDILLSMSHNTLTSAKEFGKMRVMHLKSKVAQPELSDLGRRSPAL